MNDTELKPETTDYLYFLRKQDGWAWGVFNAKDNTLTARRTTLEDVAEKLNSIGADWAVPHLEELDPGDSVRIHGDGESARLTFWDEEGQLSPE